MAALLAAQGNDFPHGDRYLAVASGVIT